MMLHRHFEQENQREGMTTLDDLTSKPKFGSEVFPPEEVANEAPKKRGRAKKTTEAKE